MREKILEVSSNLELYINSKIRLPMFTFLLGRKKEIYYKIDISNNQKETRDNLNTIISGMKTKIDKDYEQKDITNWNDVGFTSSLFYKKLTQEEINFFFTNEYFKEGKKQDFIKKRYNPRLFIIELRFTQDGNKRLMIIQNVIKGFALDFNYHLNIMDERLPIQILDNTKGFTLKNDYSIVIYLENYRSKIGYMIIKEKKPFENLMNYYGAYNSAYEQINALDYIDFSKIKPTVDLKRRCFQLIYNKRFEKAQSRFLEELSSPRINEIKRALQTRGIDYQPTSTGYKIIPHDITQAKTCLRMLSDGVVKTILLGRDGIADHIDETPP